MKIQVLGTCCNKCQLLFEATEKALREAGIAAKVEKIEDIREIMKFKVVSTPALVIDGLVVVSGRIPGIAEIKTMLECHK